MNNTYKKINLYKNFAEIDIKINISIIISYINYKANEFYY